MTEHTDAPVAKPRVLYFTACHIGAENSGGMLVCREHVRQLAGLKDIELSVATIVNSFKVGHVHAEFGPYSPQLRPQPSSISPRGRWPFLWELLARQEAHINEWMTNLVETLEPEIVIVDYVLSAVWAPAIYSLPVRRITITLNREADFFGLERRIGNFRSDVSYSAMAQWRLRRFENWVYRNSDAVVALTEGDLPVAQLRPDAEGVVIPPMLGERDARWRYTANRHIYFVGNVSHFPNYDAVEWLATCFAPEMEKRDPGVLVVVVGASRDDVPPEWLRPNIEFRGFATTEEVRERFVTSDLFIAPVANNFGSKIKVLECFAHGTPLIATKSALSGVPFADLVPQFRVEDPEEAVTLALKLMNDGKKLHELGSRLTGEMHAARKRSSTSWSELIKRVSGGPVKTSRWLSFLLNFAKRLRRGRVWIGKMVGTPKEIGVSWNNAVKIAGAYEAEISPERSLRWTGGNAKFEMQIDPQNPPKSIRFKFWGIAPENGTDVCLSVNGIELYSCRINGQPVAETLKLPVLVGHRLLVLNVKSSVFQPEGDERKLGVAIESIAIDL